MAEHTKTPWRVDDKFPSIVLDVDGIDIAESALRIHEPDAKARQFATAEFIVRACNAHETLLEALKSAVNALHLNPDVCQDEIDSTLVEINSAIAKAEGK